MFFFIDKFDQVQSVEVFPNLEKLALYALGKMGISLELGADPIRLAQSNLGNRGQVTTLAGAFKMIANAEGNNAQELALQFQQALERYRK